MARRMEISDQLKQDSRTVFSLEEVSFGVDLESEIFTRRWLERRLVEHRGLPGSSVTTARSVYSPRFSRLAAEPRASRR